MYVLVVAAGWDTTRIALGLLLVPLTLIDLDIRRLPDALTGSRSTGTMSSGVGQAAAQSLSSSASSSAGSNEGRRSKA